jgi:thioredoxin reductase
VVEVVIIGAGPAGLAAALTLARSRRGTLVLDAGRGRNADAEAVHGFLSRDGTAPEQLRRAARQDLTAYPDVELRDVAVLAAAAAPDGFRVTLADATEVTARRLVLATGVVDELPAIDGLAPLWGRSALHCFYCHGWEVRDQPLAMLALRPVDLAFAVQLRRWSADLTLCTGGRSDLMFGEDERSLLGKVSIGLRDEPVARLDGHDGILERIVFSSGEPLRPRALFLHPPARQRSPLAARLGCELLEDGIVAVDELGRTSVPGVYAAGDMARRRSLPIRGQQVGAAAAAGQLAAIALDRELALADVLGQATGRAERAIRPFVARLLGTP